MRQAVTLLKIVAVVMLSIILAGCGGSGNGETVPSVTSTVASTPTNPPAVRGNIHETPVPAPVSVSALVDIRQRREVRVGVLYNYPPFGVLADNGQVHGYEVELARRMAELWGVEATFIQVTRQTRLPLLYDGDIDLIAAAMPHRRELEQFVEFSDTTFLSGYGVLVLADSSISSVVDLGNSVVAAVGDEAQTALAERAAQLGISPVIQPFGTVDAAVAALTQQQVSAVVSRREDLMLPASSDGRLQILGELVSTEPYAFAVRRGDTPLRDLINLTLQQLATEGRLGEIFSSNLYGYPSDLFPTMPGESVYTFETFPTEIPSVPSIVERIRRGETLRVAGVDLSPTPALFDGQLVVDGYNRAIINEMARRWNVPIVEIPQSAGEAGLNLLRGGQADLVVGVRPNQALIGQVAFSQPYYQRGLRLIHMQDVRVQGVGDLEFKPTVAVPPLDVSEDIIRDNNDFPDVETTESYEEAFRALVSRSAYAVVGDEFSLVLMSQADATIAVYDALYRPVNYVMALPNYDVDFLALINFTLQDMKADGTLDALRQQYFGPYLPEGETLEPFPLELWPGDGSYLGVGG
jgi:polar amino acid transport system substrate-binding protein